MPAAPYDVIIVGFGPTGKVLARQLVDRGHHVEVVERWATVYPLPRAVHYDDEIKRMFDALGIGAEVERISRQAHHYVWYNADWKVLVELAPAASWARTAYLFNQPDLEAILEASLIGRDRFDLLASHEAVAVRESADRCEVDIAPFDQEKHRACLDGIRTISARYVVGCDGANSLVRRTIASPIFDHGFDAEWLVVDVQPHHIDRLQVPDAAQWCNPARPTTIIPGGAGMRRWEFMLLPGETPGEMTDEARVWDLLAPWIKPHEGTLRRCAVYRFHSQLARQWRKGRLLIAGDAAHLMPPFMGQGMCSGLRDAWTLGWRLDLVLRGIIPQATLDDYEAERSPHVDQLIRLSMQMGEIVCVTDPEAARKRDAVFFSGAAPSPPPFPGITAGAVRRQSNGSLQAGAGMLLPGVTLATDGVERGLDEIAGRNFALLLRAPRDRPDIGESAFLQNIGAAILEIGPTALRDVDGRLDALFKEMNAVAVLARPDFYAFGFAHSAQDVSALVRDAAAHLRGSRGDFAVRAAE